MAVMDQSGLPHPIIVTESGRALVAYYSILVFNVLDVAQFEEHEVPESLPENMAEPIHNLHAVNRVLTIKNLQECYNDALYYRDMVRDLFNHEAQHLLLYWRGRT